MADDDAMLTVEPDEPVIHDVRVQHAYRTTVTLRNNSRNALELTIRAGSPERWAVAPSTVFLEAGRTMRVDLRLKLTRELRPKRLAGGAGAAADHASGEGTQQAPHRQRDVFHIKTPYFERRFHASFTVADESEPRKEVPIEDRGRSVSFAPSASGAGAGALRDRARSASPRRFRGDDEIARETRRAVSAPRRRPEGQDVARLDRDDIRALDDRLDQLERANRRAALDLRDKEELIRALTSRLELRDAATNDAATSRESSDAAAGESDPDVSGSRPPLRSLGSLAESRAKVAELTGANAALRSRCQELDGEAKAARDEAAGLRRRVAALAAEKAPTLVDLVAQAVAEERAAFEAQSLKALRVLEAKDAVLASREREVAEARAECGAAQSTLAATRRELDACERRLIATLDEQGKLRAEVASLVDSRDGAERRTRETVSALKAEIDALREKSRNDAEDAARAARAEEECAFLRAAADSASAALDAAKAECSGLRASLRSAAELRAAERAQLTAHVAAAEHERVALERAAEGGAPGAELRTAELRNAHRALASALESSRGDALLTGAAARAAAEAETAVRARKPPSAGKPPLPVASAAAGSAASADAAPRDAPVDESEPAPAPEPASASPSAASHASAKEVAALRLQVKELQSALRLRDGDARRSLSRAEAERAAETEALRTELAALRERLRRAARESGAGDDRGDAISGGSNVSKADFVEMETRVRAAESRAAAAESEARAARERLSRAEARRGASGGAGGSGRGVLDASTSAEARLSARVTELLGELAAANRRVAELTNKRDDTVGSRGGGGVVSRGSRRRSAGGSPRSESAADETDESRLAIRWENERARLESKLRAAKEDGAVRVQSLEATVASLRARSGLHAEVARLGEAAGSAARAEAKARHDLALAEEKLGKALLRLRAAGVDDAEVPEDMYDAFPSPAHAADHARALGSAAVHGASTSAGLGGAIRDRQIGEPSASDSASGGDALKIATRYQAEIDRLKSEVERVTLEIGREASARADTARELAAALDRVAERDRALHDVREQAALGRERAAATRARELGDATRARGDAEARALDAERMASDAKEEARVARSECARRVAASETMRRAAERASEASAAAAERSAAESASSKRDAERLASTLDERAAQLRILTETVEALQASAGSGDREQKIVTLAAQAATARASEAALERRCAELAADAATKAARANRLETETASLRRKRAEAETRASAAEEKEAQACEERAAAREQTHAKEEETSALARRLDAESNARAMAEARETAARAALEAQHARHLEQLASEREDANERLRAAADDAARAAGVVGVVSAATYGNAAHAHIASRDELLDAAREAAAARERIERHLADVADAARAAAASAESADKENASGASGTSRQTGATMRFGKTNDGVSNDARSRPTRRSTRTRAASDAEWSSAVIQRLRQLVLEAERDIGRAAAAARAAAAGESAAHRRAAAAEAALDARTAAWEEATAAATAAEERLARREQVIGRCAEERAGHAYARVEKLEEALASATRRLTSTALEARNAKAQAEEATRRAEAFGRRALVAEADAAAAKQAAAAAAEELEGSPNGSDAVRDLKAYFESEIVGRAILGVGDESKSTEKNPKANEGENARLVGVTRELCAAKLTERSLLASLAANRRRADAAAAHAAELRAALENAEARLAESVSERAAVAESDAENAASEGASELAARLSREAHASREETLRLRARVSELELETAELAGAREAAAVAAKAAREGARAEIAAAAARDAEAFAAKAASLRRDAEAERDALRASLREAQARAQAARAETAMVLSDARDGSEGPDGGRTRAYRGAPAVAASAAEARAEKAEGKARKLTRLVADLRDEVKAKDEAVDQLRRAFDLHVSSASASSGGARKGKRASSSAPDAVSAGAAAVASSSASNAALGRRLVEARLAEADAQRRLKITARAEAEYRALVADRDAKLVDLERKLRRAAAEIAAGAAGVTSGTSGAVSGVSTSGVSISGASAGTPSGTASARSTTPRTTPRATPAKAPPPFKPPGTTSRAAAAAAEGKDGVNAKGKSIASLAAAAAAARRGLMPPSSSDEDLESADVATVSLEPEPDPSASSAPAPRGGAAPENVGAASFSPEVLASGDIASHLALESECARLRAARARAEAEAERLAAELAAFKAHAPEPEEMDALRDEAASLRERVAVLASEDGKESKESLRADVHDAVVLAAAALAGGPAARSAASAAPPAPGTAAAATTQLVGALRETRNELFRAKQELRDATRALRERGREKTAADEAESSRRDVIRELTQRAAVLGRDKAELVDERDKLRERCRALRRERDGVSRSADGAGAQVGEPNATFSSVGDPNASRGDRRADAETQVGPARGDAGALVDATALGEVLRQRVAGVERAAAFALRKAKTPMEVGGDVAEFARSANALAVDAAALRAAVEALCSSDARDENLSPTEMVTAAAMAAMRAMPDAPLVHAVVPSVVAAAMVTAPLVADPNAVDAPVALAARPAARDVATDVDGLRHAVDVGTDAAAMTRAAKSGPDARDDPEVRLAAPRDVGTSPGVGERVRDASVGVGTRSASPPPGFTSFPPETRDSGVDPSPLLADKALNTDLSAASFAKDVTATRARDEALSELAELKETDAREREKTAKWKARCESLRLELAGAMEKRAEAEEKVSALRATLDAAETRERERASARALASAASAGVGEGEGAADAFSAASLPDTEEGVAEFLASAKRRADEAVAAADALRRELETREDEHAKAVSATRAAIRNLRGSSPADRAAYLEALRIHAEDAEKRRAEREARPVLKNALRVPAAAPPPERQETPSRANIAAALARRALAEGNADALTERVFAAETRLERALASTATALAVAERGARRGHELAQKEARVIAAKLEETESLCAAAIARCDDSERAAAEAGKKARWTHVARCARYRELLRELLEEHKSDRRVAANALAAAEQRARDAEARAEAKANDAANDARLITHTADDDDASPPKRRRSAMRATDSDSDEFSAEERNGGFVRVAVAEIEARDAARRPARRAARAAPSSSGSDADVGPAAAAAKAELRAEDIERVAKETEGVSRGKQKEKERAKPPFALGGSPARSDASDVDIPVGSMAAAAATKARELLGKLLASRDDVERLDWLEARARETELELERLRHARDRATAAGAKAERRARHLSARVEQMRRAAAEAEKAAKTFGPAALAAAEARASDAEEKLRRAKADGARLKAVTGDIKSALDRVKAEKSKVAALEKSLAEAHAKASEKQASLDRRDGALADVTAKLDASRVKIEKLESAARAAGGADAARGDELKRLREERDRLSASLAQLRERADRAVRDAALEAETAERERCELKTERLRRDAKRKDALLASHDARIEAARAETEEARAALAEARRETADAFAAGTASASSARRASMAMLDGVRALAARLCRLAAAVGHTVGAAEKKDRDEVAGAAARSAAELVDFAPDEIAALLDADADGNRVSGGRAASPETFAKLVHAMETRADELAAAMVSGGDGEFVVPGDALRWIVSAAEAEAEHAEAALKSAVPSMHDWWNGGASSSAPPSPAPAPAARRKQKKEKKESGREGGGAETGARANLLAAARLLASSGDDDSS